MKVYKKTNKTKVSNTSRIDPVNNKNDFKKVKSILQGGYDPSKNVAGTIKDKSLSGKRVSVYQDTTNAKTYVVHRGTHRAKDWLTDMAMAVGFEGTNRFKHSEKMQQKAENKYGQENIVTVGHSLGGRLAEKFGKNSSQIITYNKAATPRSIITSHIKKLPSKQLDIRTTNDPVSILSKFQKSANKVQNVKSNTINPIAAHSLDVLKFNNFQ